MDLRHPASGADVLVDALQRVREEEARLAARRARIIDALQRQNVADQQRLVWGVSNPHEAAQLVERCTRAEVARALRVHEQRAASLIAQSHALCDSLPCTLAAMESGELSPAQAAVVVDEHWSLPAGTVADFDARAAGGRLDVPRSVFVRRIRALRDRILPASIDLRTRDNIARRRIDVEHGPDGMSWLTACLPTPQAVAVHAALTASAHDAADAGDPRTQAQLRADVLVDAVLRGGPSLTPADAADPVAALRGVVAEVSITVPVLSLLGMSTEPAVLDGVGPIPREVARTLAAGARSWHRVLTHPISGTILAYDRRSYRVPHDLKRWLQRRDRACRFPGCTVDAKRCDIDHVIPWARGGSTNADNLQALCRAHHRLRHHTPWSPAMHPDERAVWTSPTARVYDTAPDESWAIPADPVPPAVLAMLEERIGDELELESHQYCGASLIPGAA